MVNKECLNKRNEMNSCTGFPWKKNPVIRFFFSFLKPRDLTFVKHKCNNIYNLQGRSCWVSWEVGEETTAEIQGRHWEQIKWQENGLPVSASSLKPSLCFSPTSHDPSQCCRITAYIGGPFIYLLFTYLRLNMDKRQGEHFYSYGLCAFKAWIILLVYDTLRNVPT